jgi:hypothetical protein
LKHFLVLTQAVTGVAADAPVFTTASNTTFTILSFTTLRIRTTTINQSREENGSILEEIHYQQLLQLILSRKSFFYNWFPTSFCNPCSSMFVDYD